FHSHAHYGWDNSLSPITEVSSGQTVNYEIIEASGGQFTRYSSKEDVANINFAKVNPVSGPIYIKDTEPDDTLEIEMIDFRQLDWGWTALIPVFGLLSDTFTEPEIKIFDLKNRIRAQFFHGLDIFIILFSVMMGVALAYV